MLKLRNTASGDDKKNRNKNNINGNER
jgi:hypothetical protein